MPLTDQDIRALVYIASRVRAETCAGNRGARQWDDAGTFANIAKVRHLHLADVAQSVVRAADDAKADSPGVIANTSAPNWQERQTGRPRPHEPYDVGGTCAHCEQPEARCRAINDRSPDPHEYESKPAYARRLAEQPPRHEETA